ncbi:tRNA (adenosine(37)-N6)-threonylcarbamoyltransferase complex dimerization subunit type 1 TsaB [Acinetobacter sp. S40]|uniref:tRNA (adenosine(37)-N6)-threonylcarbamoyltransferase complex dimerization subunit type 1 TsaB n=1 Tax=unclassified Acinetobacter TaxID=196816 RepID=UPI00190D4EE2|nr:MULTISPECIES: tRNA (adenosine(37)-N6)-threonylcarbamoyltransferase complex dimerization subunit type 1 TsaB [unclassified Acinetobacter]MBJ9985936.1 tRNA (adenosine(37)-N6)-threonylcarbamoyltransferase complex dimerization subunit type 1 TsaB [Acinetobacter sp. S40]MBK0064439.1 tRNA (adenosine(37)-N6)-threonylcarbamoyltransferase complex dimerization subunit type 1 TsaB [Acinetobacter sp. S55]MBK0067137.1 tRNA (adenosine(37)-N6)-threonylcarbamoyltransferase complex dimerization subunit type 1
MNVLALETANDHCSVCLIDQSNELFFQMDTQAKAQTRTILPMIEQALQQAQISYSDLTAIAFSRGPGSFSGVRINAAVTQALAWANDLPVIPVSTLQALAQAAYRELQLSQVTAILDARMQEVYLANFSCDEDGIMQLHGQEQLLNYELAQSYAQFTCVGSGAKLISSSVSEPSSSLSPSARDIALLARHYAKQKCWVSAEQALPVYLRDNAWKKIAEQGKSN